MIERLLFYRIDAETAGAPVADQLDTVIQALAHVAQTTLPFLQAAVPRAEITLHATIIGTVPVIGIDNMCIHTLYLGAKTPTSSKVMRIDD